MGAGGIVSRFPNKTVVITGAGSGLGRQLSLRFANAGWQVAVAGRNRAGCEETLAQVERAGGAGWVFECLVDRPDEVEALCDEAYRRWEGVDVLVNNAGMGAGGRFVDLTPEDWEVVLATNLLGVVNGCRSFARRMQRQGHGHLVNVSSLAAVAQLPYMSNYNVSKAGVVALSETLRSELRGSGIRVSVACPSGFNTQIHHKAQVPEAYREGARELVARFNAHGRVDATRIAEIIYAAVLSGRFWVFPNRIHGGLGWRVKRWLPGPWALAMRVVARRIGRLLDAAERNQ